jgi:hypothetical protein
VMVLPRLSVVVTAVWDVGVLDGDAEVPVASSDVPSVLVVSLKSLVV